jgi:uracil-DNA glycosylase
MSQHEVLLQSVWSNVLQATPHRELITPGERLVFSAMSMPINEVAVVFIGQDPYPTAGMATGRSFEVSAATHQLPPTLKNIAAEYTADTGKSFTNETIGSWARQGVLMLNAHLTTQVGISLAHKSVGWGDYTRLILREVREAQPHVIGVLWGRQAQEFRSCFGVGHTLQSPHPSPLAAHRGFFGSRPFTGVNTLLQRRNRTLMVW